MFGEIRVSQKVVRSQSGVGLMIDLHAIQITPRDEFEKEQVESCSPAIS